VLFFSPLDVRRPAKRNKAPGLRVRVGGRALAVKESTAMVRRFLVLGLCAAALACSQQKTPSQKAKSGPAVARGKGITITADEFKARLDEQSPFIRARYSTLERKKEFLDNLIRFEVLAQEAERQGLGDDPDVQQTLKKIMVQKLVQKSFQDPGASTDVPDADVQKYYDEHLEEYVRPRRVRAAAIVLEAPQGSADRAKKLAAAQKAVARLKADGKRDPLAFAQLVSELSDDAATKASGGDLQFKSREELERAYSKELADAVFSLKPGETSGVVQSAKALYVVRFTGEQPELNRTFEQVKPQIANKLSREKKTKDFDEWLKQLREQAGVSVDEAALEAIEVAANSPAQPGAHGHAGGGMGGAPTMPPGGRPAPASAVK
jgi:peptidyl-prolyl cis-trans isomerase C